VCTSVLYLIDENSTLLILGSIYLDGVGGALPLLLLLDLRFLADETSKPVFLLLHICHLPQKNITCRNKENI
jgi:hypothetical protein